MKTAFHPVFCLNAQTFAGFRVAFEARFTLHGKGEDLLQHPDLTLEAAAGETEAKVKTVLEPLLRAERFLHRHGGKLSELLT